MQGVASRLTLPVRLILIQHINFLRDLHLLYGQKRFNTITNCEKA